MKPIDEYHRWVEWSDEDQVYSGTCPDLITGNPGDDPVKGYQELGEAVQEVLDDLQQSGRRPPAAADLDPNPRPEGSPGRSRASTKSSDANTTSDIFRAAKAK